MSIVVFSVAKREIGLIVPHLVDIRQISTNVDTCTLRQRGIFGSVIVQDATTRLLNLYELAEIAHPDWFVNMEMPVASNEQGQARLLIVEDSAFFRSQLSGLLEGVGYAVQTAIDGQDAWELLKRSEASFDLVVTDIEMPRMDGLQLAQHIRDDAALAHLPIVAVTSLGRIVRLIFNRNC